MPHNNIRLLFQKALAHHQGGKLVLAQGIYQQILREDPEHFDSCHLLGVILIQTGQPRKGTEVLINAAKLKPSSDEVYYNLAHAWHSLGNIESMLSCLKTAIALNPQDPEYHLEIGSVQLELEQFHEALASCDRAVALKPDYAEAYVNQGIALKELGRIEEALASYDKAINLKPDYAEAYSNRGNALKEVNRFDEALVNQDQAISLKPDYAEAFSNRGNVLMELRQLEEALTSYDKAIGLKPDYAEAFSNRGNALKELDRLHEALASYEKAISLKPDYAEVYRNRGNTLMQLRRLEEALASYDKAINLKSDYAEAYNDCGAALHALLRLDEALASYDKAISLKHDYSSGHYNKSLLLMSTKHYESGFELYRWRWRAKNFISRHLATTLNRWNGDPAAQHLLLWAEQGIGDEIFYSSMISLINPGTMVTLSADRRLHNIYRRSFPNISLVDRLAQNKAINSGYDAQAPIGDLGYLLNVSSELIERRRYPFLVASEKRKQDLLTTNIFLQKMPICGIAWKSANKKIGEEKSIALLDLKPILELKQITFVNLQYGDVEAEIDEVAREIGTTIYRAEDLDVFNDIDGLLSLIDVCDIVVTTSNVTAHLAGAIGKRAAVFIPRGKGRIWYWHDEPQSVWYPSLKIFSQPDDWSWSSAISDAANWVKESLC